MGNYIILIIIGLFLVWDIINTFKRRATMDRLFQQLKTIGSRKSRLGRVPVLESIAWAISDSIEKADIKVDDILKEVSEASQTLVTLLRISEQGDRFEEDLTVRPDHIQLIANKLKLNLGDTVGNYPVIYNLKPDERLSVMARMIMFRQGSSKYYSILVSKVYEDENFERIIRSKPKRVLKDDLTIKDCEKLCKQYDVDFKDTNEWLKYNEDYSILCIPGPKGQKEKPWVLGTHHLGELRTPPLKHYLALMLLLKKIESN